MTEVVIFHQLLSGDWMFSYVSSFYRLILSFSNIFQLSRVVQKTVLDA